MNLNDLIKGNRIFFARYYKLVAWAVVITTAVITGSLMIGDSVRSTLVNRVNERLGSTETVIFSMQSFMDSSIVHHPVLEGNTRALLVTNGFISQAGRLIPVMVWGVNDMDIPAGKARINQPLAKELNILQRGVSLTPLQSGQKEVSILSPFGGGRGRLQFSIQDDIVLRLPATGMVPSGSLFVTDNYTTSMRLALDGIFDVKQQGNLSLKNEQTLPLNIFVNRNELAETIETQGKVNLLLSDRIITSDDLKKTWNPALSGLKMAVRNGVAEITSDRVFIQDEVVQTIYSQTTHPNRLFSYLVNSIEHNGGNIPYSFVTAMDTYRGSEIKTDEIILSDYTSRRLGVKEKDTLQLTFFTSGDLKTLRTDTVRLCVGRIVPIRELVADSTLSTDFPGLSDVDRCTDWDSDLPLNMSLITDDDEQYWNDYRSTPKAIIAYRAIAEKWSNAFGSATALRIDLPLPPPKEDRMEKSLYPPPEGDNSGFPTSPDKGINPLANSQLGESISPLQKFYPPLLEGAGGGLLSPSMFGIQLTHPREQALQAAQSGVDFSGLFLALGFFIILSAILLMLVPLSEMLFQRKDETALLHSLGYTTRRIVKIYLQESVLTVIKSSGAGVIAGMIYTWVVLFLLGTVWKGATHTERFRIYPNIQTIITGLLAGILLSVSLLWMALRRSLKNTVRRKSIKQISLRHKLIQAVIISPLVLLIALINQAYIMSTELFVLMGILFVATAALWGDYILCRTGSISGKSITKTSPVWKTLFAGRKQAILSFFPLAIGVFIVFSVGLNRKGFADNAQIMTGTGGFSLWCETGVPVYHNLSTALGREKLALTELPAKTEILQLLRYGADDASCLNLNKVSNPTVLGIDMEQLSRSRFKISRRLDGDKEINEFESFRKRTGSIYPVLVDETVLTWGLGLKLGDTIVYKDSKGQNVIFRLTGTLHNSIFQGNILIDRNLFSEIWDDIAGSEVMLVKTDEEATESVKMLISQALSDYGISVTSANDRLKMFNSVTDTYLTIFLMLGSIGMLLGIMSFMIVIRKNLASKRNEMNVYRSLGFPKQRIINFLRIENNIVPLYAIGTGIIGAILAAGGGIAQVSIWIWLTSLCFAGMFVASVVGFVKREVNKNVGA